MQILNEIEFLSPEIIIPHEEPSLIKLNKLISKIENDGFINHPILCTKLKDKIIILDGTHRFYALKHLNVKFIPIQLVRYDKRKVKLSSWCWQFKIDDKFLNIIRNFDGNFIRELRRPRNYEILIKSNESFILKFKNRMEFLKFLGTLNNFDYERVLREQLIEGIVFPTLNHKFFLFLANNGYRIPSGITRFKVQHRILFLKVPLNVLNNHDKILEFKNQIQNRKYRVYEESVVIFEE
ncbi:MAG: ParB/RepB/Spo0J family partition protein [candidate division WOR-3 bacterium]